MSNQAYYGSPPPQGQAPPNIQSNNPYASQQQQGHPNQQANSQSEYNPPPGPPPHRAGTFQESDFVPDSQRGEQREAMEQFEMNRNQPESETESNVAKLQAEFPGVDGSLIAALYGDSNSLSATREMLNELASGGQAERR